MAISLPARNLEPHAMILTAAIRAYRAIPQPLRPRCSCGRPPGSTCSAVALELAQRLGTRRALPLVLPMWSRCYHDTPQPATSNGAGFLVVS